MYSGKEEESRVMLPSSLWLRPFFDFDDLVSNQTVRLTVYRNRCFLVGRFNQTKDLAIYHF